MSVAPLPQGWCVATIMDTSAVSGGATPSKADASYWAGGTIPWVSPKDMKRFVLTGSEDVVTAKALDRLTLIPANSILVVVRSGILSRTLPVAINTVPVTINQDLRAFVPSRSVEPRYVAWQLIANEREILDRCSKDGTTVASIEGPALASYPFAIAPAAEQARIVDKLEELLSDLDAGVAELKAAQKKLAQYRQSLLKAAVEGRLTEAWRAQHGEPEESGAQLLARILRERRARWEAKQLSKFEARGKAPQKGWQNKYPEPLTPEQAELEALPVGWTWVTIDQLADVGTGVTPLRSKPQYFANGTIPWVTSGALNDEVVKAAKEHVTDLAIKECRLELYPPGSLLVAMYGEGKTRGKCAELPFAATLNQAIACLVFESAANACKDYVKTFLLKSYELMREQASGGVQPNLNLQIVKSIVLPLPPLSEQSAIGSSIIEHFEQLHQQAEAIPRALRQSAAQRKNILQAAFSGQLVPQDPNDEPASELLARIRAERESRLAKARKPRATKESA